MAGRSQGEAAASHTYGGKLTTIINTLAEFPARLESIKKELMSLEWPLLEDMEFLSLSPWGIDETLGQVKLSF